LRETQGSSHKRTTNEQGRGGRVCTYADLGVQLRSGDKSARRLVNASSMSRTGSGPTGAARWSASTVRTDAMDGKRVLVLFEPGRGGAAVLEFARELVACQRATLTVVSVAPHGVSGARCGNSALDYNLVVQDSVAEDLDHARAWLGEFGAHASFELLIERASPSLEEFAAAGGFDLVLLPARRRPLRAPGHPAAERLRVATGAELQVIARRQQREHA
jgi:hypothetical protein